MIDRWHREQTPDAAHVEALHDEIMYAWGREPVGGKMATRTPVKDMWIGIAAAVAMGVLGLAFLTHVDDGSGPRHSEDGTPMPESAGQWTPRDVGHEHGQVPTPGKVFEWPATQRELVLKDVPMTMKTVDRVVSTLHYDSTLRSPETLWRTAVVVAVDGSLCSVGRDWYVGKPGETLDCRWVEP